MQKKATSQWPEVVVSIGDKSYTQAVRRAAKAGVLRKIGSKIYSSNLKDTPENIIKRHRYQILGQLFPKAVISHRSALDGGILAEGAVFLTYKYTRTVQWPGLTVRLVRGPGPDEEDTLFLENLFISSRGRAFLENLIPSRERKGFIKKVPLDSLEDRLDRMARIYGPEELNRLRDQAHRVAVRLGMEREYAALNKLIGGFLGTRPDAKQVTAAGRARASGEPFDPQRVELFAVLTAYLLHDVLPVYKRTAISPQARINQAFFESYFSNYIEGTVFEVREAEQIIFENKMIPHRTADSHDILGTFQIVSNSKWMETTPKSSQELIDILQHRHAILMEVREDKMPGRFKDSINRVGNTIFVKPEEVRGTLIKGIEFYNQLPVGIAKAIFMMFLIAEVHPFVDGNGRIARILMNAELDVANQSRIIIPTVFREDYLLTLRKLSRMHDPIPYVKMLLKAQQFTAALPYDVYEETLGQLHACNAFLEPNEGKLVIPYCK